MPEENSGDRLTRSDFLKRGFMSLFVGGAILSVASACGMEEDDDDDEDDD